MLKLTRRDAAAAVCLMLGLGIGWLMPRLVVNIGQTFQGPTTARPPEKASPESPKVRPAQDAADPDIRPAREKATPEPALFKKAAAPWRRVISQVSVAAHSLPSLPHRGVLTCGAHPLPMGR